MESRKYILSKYSDKTRGKALGKCAHLNPVVVLTDIVKSAQLLKQHKIQNHTESQPQVNEKPRGREEETIKIVQKPKKDEKSEEFNGCKTPSKRSRKRKATWDPTMEYEVERILGHHRDAKTQKILYRVLWKNYKCTTLEPIENLTNCIFELMNYLENETKPPEAKIAKKNQEIKDLLNKQLSADQTKLTVHNIKLYQSLDLKEIFTGRDLLALETIIRTEYGYILRCIVAMSDFPDPGLIQRALDYLLYIKLIEYRRRQLETLQEIEKKINMVEKVPITVENAVDFDMFPKVTYVAEMILKEGFVMPEPVVGCECGKSCSSESYCCGEMAEFSFAYDTAGRYRFSEKTAIYECNSKCKCDKSCPNRVVQRGRKFKLGIFKTTNYGWGVKALENIPQGSFVCEYFGELVAETDLRRHPNAVFGQSYIFNLDFDVDNEKMYCVDATEYGNVSRFINHSCDPNLIVLPVWIDCLAENLHRLAFFAYKDIQKGEEITFDYEGSDLDPTNVEENGKAPMRQGLLKCLCGQPKCRGWLFRI